MIILYMVVGFLFLSTDIFPGLAGTSRNILGFALIAFALYRSFYFYIRFIRKRNDD